MMMMMMTSLRKCTKCYNQKQYYKEPRHSKVCPLTKGLQYLIYYMDLCSYDPSLSLTLTPNRLIYSSFTDWVLTKAIYAYHEKVTQL